MPKKKFVKKNRKKGVKKGDTATHVTIKRMNHSLIYPDIMKTTMVTAGTAEYLVSGAAASPQYLQWQGNQLYTSAGPTGVGPLVNFTGAFGANVPTGLFQLLGTETNTGGVTIGGQFIPNGVYAQYRVIRCSIEIKFNPTQQYNASLQPDSGYILILTPKIVLNNAPVGTLNNVREEPYAKELILPASITAKIPKLKHAMTTEKMYGLRHSLLLENVEYTGTATGGVSSKWFWELGIYSPDGAIVSGACYWKLTHDIEFFNRNNIISTTPV